MLNHVCLSQPYSAAKQPAFKNRVPTSTIARQFAESRVRTREEVIASMERLDMIKAKVDASKARLGEPVQKKSILPGENHQHAEVVESECVWPKYDEDHAVAWFAQHMKGKYPKI